MSRATLASLPSAVAENKSRKKPAGICTKRNCRQSPYNSHLIRQFPSPIFLIPTHFAASDFPSFLHPSLSPPPSSVSSTPGIALNMYHAASPPLACLPLNLSARAVNSGIQRKRKMRTSEERGESPRKKIRLYYAETFLPAKKPNRFRRSRIRRLFNPFRQVSKNSTRSGWSH